MSEFGVPDDRGHVIGCTVEMAHVDGEGWVCRIRFKRAGEARAHSSYELYDRLTLAELLDVVDVVLGTSLDLD